MLLPSPVVHDNTFSQGGPGNLVAMALSDVPGSSVIERRSMGERFLKGIREAWEEHNTSMNMTADIMMYLDRGFTQGQNRPTIFAATIGRVKFKKRCQEGCHPTGARQGHSEGCSCRHT
jgi:hypothetical protein